jgi:hypothetical protein
MWAGSMLVKATEVGTPCSEGREDKKMPMGWPCPGASSEATSPTPL